MIVCCWLDSNVGHFPGRLLSVLPALISPVQSHPRLEAAGTIAGEQVIVSLLEAQGESNEALAAHPEVARFIMWVACQPPTADVCVAPPLLTQHDGASGRGIPSDLRRWVAIGLGLSDRFFVSKFLE